MWWWWSVAMWLAEAVAALMAIAATLAAMQRWCSSEGGRAAAAVAATATAAMRRDGEQREEVEADDNSDGGAATTLREQQTSSAITWVATVTTSAATNTMHSTAIETEGEHATASPPPLVQPEEEEEAAREAAREAPPPQPPPLVTPYNPIPIPIPNAIATPYPSSSGGAGFPNKLKGGGTIVEDKAATRQEESASTKSDNETKPCKRRQRKHKATKVQVGEEEEEKPAPVAEAAEEEEEKKSDGFPSADDEVLEGAEEGLDPKGPLRLQKCVRFGRYLAAARALSAGERVLCEGAALLGPRADASAPSCVRCLRALPRPPPLCATCCAAPLCARCRHADAPFGEAECAWLRGRRGPPPDLCRPRVVLCVRALLLRRSGDRRWERIERLEAHEEARRGGEAWEETRVHVVEPLRAAALLFPDEDEALLQRISGILDVNTFEVRGGGDGGGGRALFPAAALLAHDCLPSAHVAVDEQHTVHVRTARALAPGQPLTLCYAAPLQSTAERQEHLLQGKYFRCACSRCSDPEECGTRLGGVRCPKCRKGDLLPPTTTGGWWQCRGADGASGCGHRAPPQLAATTHARARDLVEAAATTGDEREMEALLARLRRSLPFSSSPALTLIQALMASYRSRLQSDVRPPAALLQRQAALARELLSAVSRLAPGDPRLAAVARYELHGALAALAQRKHSGGATPAATAAAEGRALAEGLREAEKELSKAAAALLLEPPASPEGRLGRAAVAQLRELREDILQAESLATEQEAKRAEAERRRQRQRRAGGGGGGGKEQQQQTVATAAATATPPPPPPPPVDTSAPGGGKKKRRRGKNTQQQQQQQCV